MSTSVASLTTNFFPSAENGFTTTTSGSVASAATTVGLNSVAGYTNGEVVVFVIDPTDATKKQTFTGVIDTAGSQVTSVVWTAGTNQTHALGATVVDYATATHISMMTKGILEHANQDGTLITQAVRDALNLDSGSSDGWTPFGYSLTSITALGNRSYTAVVSGVDTTGTTSVGMRLKLPRTVTAPTYMGGAFNGSSHYFTKVTPTGTLSTVTNNFTIMAHVEPTVYGTQGYICGRSDAASNNGFGLYINTNGTISVIVFNTLQANNRYITTYQSLPINKKTHVAASWTSGTVVIYFDGKSVPVGPATTNGTAPTTAGTGGDFSIGRMGASGAYWTGYASSVGVFDAVLTGATILQHMNQALTGSETNCIGAWNLNNAATDATASANNLTATGGVGYTARSPYTNPVTGTSVTAGTTNYGIIMAQTFSTNTTYTIQIPEGETLPTTGGIGTVSYSTQKTPYGFPIGKTGVLATSLLGTVATGTTISDVSALTLPSITFNGNMPVRIKVWTPYCNTAGGAGQSALIYLFDGATQLQRAQFTTAAASYSQQLGLETPVFTPTSGAHTYRVQAASTSGNYQVGADATYPAFITIEAVGLE